MCRSRAGNDRGGGGCRRITRGPCRRKQEARRIRRSALPRCPAPRRLGHPRACSCSVGSHRTAVYDARTAGGIGHWTARLPDARIGHAAIVVRCAWLAAGRTTPALAQWLGSLSPTRSSRFRIPSVGADSIDSSLRPRAPELPFSRRCLRRSPAGLRPHTIGVPCASSY